MGDVTPISFKCFCNGGFQHEINSVNYNWLHFLLMQKRELPLKVLRTVKRFVQSESTFLEPIV